MELDDRVNLVNARCSVMFIVERVRKGSKPAVAEELLIVKDTLDTSARLMRRVVSAYVAGFRPPPDVVNELQQLLAGYNEGDWPFVEEQR